MSEKQHQWQISLGRQPAAIRAQCPYCKAWSGVIKAEIIKGVVLCGNCAGHFRYIDGAAVKRSPHRRKWSSMSEVERTPSDITIGLRKDQP